MAEEIIPTKMHNTEEDELPPIGADRKQMVFILELIDFLSGISEQPRAFKSVDKANEAALAKFKELCPELTEENYSTDDDMWGCFYCWGGRVCITVIATELLE